MNSAFPELDQIEFANKIEYDEPEYWGSHSRRGLMKTLPGDKITDYVINMNGITIEINDKESNLENLEHIDTYNNRLFAKNLLSDRYIEYFHNNLQKVELISNEHTNRNLLIIGDSYVNPCERFYALSFDKVVHVDTQSFKDSLQQLTNENNFTDVLILQSDTNHYDDEQLAKFIKLLESW